MTIETVKGFRDILFPESMKRRKIRETVEKNFKLFGFMPVETPTIEYEELAKGDNEKDSAVSERFKLKDRGERELALRYEFTFQLKRLFKENPNIKLPLRKYSIGNVFRDEPITKDRYREFIQMDADIIGDESINADIECIALAGKICEELGLECEVKINNRKLLNSIFERLLIKDKENVSREIDKLGKLTEKEIKTNLKKILNEKQINDLFKILSKYIDYFVKEKFEGASEVQRLLELGKSYSLNIIFSPFLIRGFSYYTGNIFEGYSDKIKGSIFAGGRYDDLVGRYVNRKIPAVGISFGRIIDYPDIQFDNTKLLIISIGQEKKAIELMNELRTDGISCIMMEKISKALEYANSYSIPYVIFLGENEVKSKKLKLRDMSTGKEKLINEKDLVKEIK